MNKQFETSMDFITTTIASFSPKISIYKQFETSDCKNITASLQYGLAAIFLQPLVLNTNSTDKLHL